MRQIFLDTETTGLKPEQGHRVIEIGAIEVIDRKPTGRRLHYYLNPGRDSDPDALRIHGLTTDFLRDKPPFSVISEALLEFVRNSELLIHNAPFDTGFLNHELGIAGLPALDNYCSVTDTLLLARELHPGKKNNLDALCERYQIDHSRRILHGALLDAELLADIYLAMTRGQKSLMMDTETVLPVNGKNIQTGQIVGNSELLVLYATTEELSCHEQYLKTIRQENKGQCIWKTPDASFTTEHS